MTTCAKIRRKSNVSDPLELTNQDMIIDPFIKKMGWKQVDEITLNGVPRWDMLDEANNLISKLKITKPDCVIYRDHDRIGFKNPAEIGFFITSLKQLDIKIITANDEQVVDMTDLASTMRTVQNQLASSAEIEKKGYRTQIARRKTIEKKSSPGKMCSYGYDWIVYNREGTFRYKVIYEGYKKYEGRHWTDPPKNTKSRANYGLMRWKEYPDGKREPYHDQWVQDGHNWILLTSVPVMEKGDRKIEIINVERSKVVKEIYNLADAPNYKTCYEIARLLNDKGIKSMSKQWDAKTIKCILTNQIYKGYPVDNQTSKAKTARLNTEVMVIPLTEEERAAIRIIDVAQWNRVNQYFKDNQTGYKRLRRANLGDFWAKCFLFCDNCQEILYITNSTKWKPSQNYRCDRCGAVKSDVIHEIIDNWLNWLSQSYITLCDKVKSSNAHEFCGEVAQKMYRFILANLPGDTEEEKVQSFKKRAWKYTVVADSNTDYFELTYQEIFDEASQTVRNKIAELKSEKQKLILKFVDISDDPDIKQFIKDKQLEIEVLEANLVSLVPEYRRSKEHLLKMASTIQTLCKDVTQATGEEKAILLRPHLKSVVLSFDNNKKDNSCKVCKVEINSVNPFIPKQVLDLKEFNFINEKYNGRCNCRLGKPMSEETRRKVSESKKRNGVNMKRDKNGWFLSKKVSLA
jgi:hypothetical protein